MSATAAVDVVSRALADARVHDPIVEQHLTKAQWANTGFPPEFRPRVFTMANCSIFVGREPVPGGDLRWHLSIAHPWRLPTWDEIKRARADLLPADVHFCQPMPPEKYWISVHNYCLHLWEIVDPSLTAQWELEVTGL